MHVHRRPEASRFRCLQQREGPASVDSVRLDGLFRLEQPVGTSSSSITLASGAYYTVHADFWNTWDQTGLQTLVNRCLNAHVDCGNNPTP